MTSEAPLLLLRVVARDRRRIRRRHIPARPWDPVPTARARSRRPAWSWWHRRRNGRGRT